MASGYLCKKCGFLESQHREANSILGNAMTDEERSNADFEINKKFPGICGEYESSDPKISKSEKNQPKNLPGWIP
ncbi:MAG: hypothetical protein JW740_00715 [Candidatus Zambryskibacteria bacterium]|nr:hypothetical protein [Candidatus Zambryskibacteria bacterium]